MELSSGSWHAYYGEKRYLHTMVRQGHNEEYLHTMVKKGHTKVYLRTMEKKRSYWGVPVYHSEKRCTCIPWWENVTLRVTAYHGEKIYHTMVYLHTMVRKSYTEVCQQCCAALMKSRIYFPRQPLGQRLPDQNLFCASTTKQNQLPQLFVIIISRSFFFF